MRFNFVEINYMVRVTKSQLRRKERVKQVLTDVVCRSTKEKKQTNLDIEKKYVEKLSDFTFLDDEFFVKE